MTGVNLVSMAATLTIDAPIKAIYFNYRSIHFYCMKIDFCYP